MIQVRMHPGNTIEYSVLNFRSQYLNNRTWWDSSYGWSWSAWGSSVRASVERVSTRRAAAWAMGVSVPQIFVLFCRIPDPGSRFPARAAPLHSCSRDPDSLGESQQARGPLDATAVNAWCTDNKYWISLIT